MELLLPAETSGNLIGQVHLADCLDLCERVYRAGVRVDMILADLPYGVHQAAWDAVIPLDSMWRGFKRIIKPHGAIVLTASQPFSSALVMSNPTMFKHEWVWVKNIGSNFLNASREPMKEHESVIVFCDGLPMYTPQRIERKDKSRAKYTYRADSKKRVGYGDIDFDTRYAEDIETRVPSSVLYFNRETGLHFNQKPVDLFRYLIRTYTLPNELIFDPTCGSGTTADGARQEGRRFIVGDSSAEYVQVARDRLAAPYTPSFMPQLEAQPA